MIKRLIIVVLFFANCNFSFSQIPDSVKAYIDTALNYMQTKSLFSNQVNWDATKDSVYLKAKNAKTYHDAFPAIVFAFQQLKDYHGMVANSDTFYRYPSPINFEEKLSTAIKKEFLKGNRFVSAVLNNSVGYLRIPSMNINNQKGIDDLSNRLRDSLCKLLQLNPKGIIIDLRMNSGGNFVPMISGLGPLFKDSLLGYGVDKDGNFLAPIKLKDGIVVDEAENKMANITNNCVANPKLRIAVLVGLSTVSSGEILAALLQQQSNVQLFGETTPGFCNSTEGFLFMNNQGYLLLTVNLIADAKKHVYNKMHVDPTVYIKSEDNYENLMEDPTVLMAIKWLAQEK